MAGCVLLWESHKLWAGGGIVLIQQTNAAETELPFWRKGRSQLFPECRLRSDGSGGKLCVCGCSFFGGWWGLRPRVLRVLRFCICKWIKNTCQWDYKSESKSVEVVIRVSSHPNLAQTHFFLWFSAPSAGKCEEGRSKIESDFSHLPHPLVSLEQSTVLAQLKLSSDVQTQPATSWITLCFCAVLLFLECAPALWLFCFLWFQRPFVSVW